MLKGSNVTTNFDHKVIFEVIIFFNIDAIISVK